MISFDVSGKRVLLIGGSSGIGYVTAEAFASAGAVVTIVADVEEVHDAAKRISAETGSQVRSIACDITDESAVDSMVESAGAVDVLINNAAVSIATPLDARDSNELFRRHLDVNVSGLYWVTQRVSASMGDGARIIFTGSIWAKSAAPHWSAYVASKHAVLGLVRTLAMELGPRGISVNAVCPGSTATETNLREMGEEKLEWLKSQMQMRPGLLPAEALAGAYLFFASPAASEITGQSLNVDRGQQMS